MKKILLLGAMPMHIPLIKRAKERNIYIMTCDNVPQNEGHRYADENHFESTTDLDAVLKLSKKLKLDGILTFNSDPAALTAAYVSEQIGLPGNKYNAVRIMSEKDLFRNFLKENDFNVPRFKEFTDLKAVLDEVNRFSLPIMIKPVDSSGSKGVSKVNNVAEIPKAYEESMNISRVKRIIVEEYIEGTGIQLHGDGFVANKRVAFSYLGDHHFNSSINNLVPYSTTFPSKYPKETITKIEGELQRLINLIGFNNGGINIEVRIGLNNNKIFLIEVGPRNGGNFTPIIIQYASGFNFIDAALDSALGIRFHNQETNKHGFYAYLIPHSAVDGVFEQIIVSKELESHILESYIYKKRGDLVVSFKGSNAAVGVFLVKFNSMEEMDYYVENFQNYYSIFLSK